MPSNLNVVCKDCKKVLYRGKFKAMHEVVDYIKRENYEDVAHCPSCGKVLKIEEMSKKVEVGEYKATR